MRNNIYTYIVLIILIVPAKLSASLLHDSLNIDDSSLYLSLSTISAEETQEERESAEKEEPTVLHVLQRCTQRAAALVTRVCDGISHSACDGLREQLTTLQWDTIYLDSLKLRYEYEHGSPPVPILQDAAFIAATTSQNSPLKLKTVKDTLYHTYRRSVSAAVLQMRTLRTAAYAYERYYRIKREIPLDRSV